MIITSKKPYTIEEIVKLQEQFGDYIKTVIDLKKKVCSAGMDRHFEGEKILLDQGSIQSEVWGGGIDTDEMVIDFNSMIKIRPHQNNNSNDILNTDLRKQYEDLTKYFLKNLYDN